MGDHYLAEGMSTSKPPRFNGSDYHYWATRMRLFLQSKGWHIWDIVENGDIKILDPNGQIKIVANLTHEEKLRLKPNMEAKLYLVCALTRDEYSKVSNCGSAKEIWESLALAHEGTNQVKESKVNLLVQEYEMFKMKNNEDIGEMFARFQSIVNGLVSLGKVYNSQDHVRKILRSLPKRWRPKVTAIQEAKDLSTLKLEELLGSLKVHELVLDDEERPRRNEVAFQASGSGTKKTSKSMDEVSVEDQDSEDPTDEDFILLARNLMRKWKKQGKFSKRKSSNDEHAKKKVVCFKCGKSGHYRSECPEWKNDKTRKNLRQKSMVATWDDSDEDTMSEPSPSKDKASICLMSRDSLHHSSSSETLYSASSLESGIDLDLQVKYRDLMHAYDEMTRCCDKLSHEKELIELQLSNSTLQIACLETENAKLFQQLENTKNLIDVKDLEITTLYEEINSLSEELSEKKDGMHLDQILAFKQKGKAGLGYKSHSPKSKGKKVLVNSSPLPKAKEEMRKDLYSKFTTPSSASNVKKNKDEMHASNSMKNHAMPKKDKINYAWKPNDSQKQYVKKSSFYMKSVSTNPKGPKQKWVPKKVIMAAVDKFGRETYLKGSMAYNWKKATLRGELVFVPSSWCK